MLQFNQTYDNYDLIVKNMGMNQQFLMNQQFFSQIPGEQN